jgi:hypothetical protein
LTPASGRHGSPSRRAIATLALLLSLGTLFALWAAAPAGAVVSEVAPGTTLGLTPRSVSLGEGEGTTFANESGNAVLHGTNVYPIFWAPEDGYQHEWLVKVDKFFQDMGASSGYLGTIFASLAQYRDRSNTPAQYSTVYHGSYSDFSKYPTSGNCTDPDALEKGAVTCLTDAQLREQLQSFIATHDLPKGMHSVYYLMTPPGVTVCAEVAGNHCSDFKLSAEEETEGRQESTSYKNSFCSYHGVINPDSATEGDANTILYATVPWTAGYSGLAFYSSFLPKHSSDRAAYVQAYTCQDGGWNPEKNEENYEAPKALTTAEEEAFTKMNSEEQEAFLEKRRLEGPRQQEPNQEGKGETGNYGPGLADLIIGQIAVEQANVVTDPMLNGWQDRTHHEVMDECRNVFGGTAGPEGGRIEGSAGPQEHTEAGTLSNEKLATGSYYINNSFSLSDDGCVGGVALVPRFTAPNPVNTNEIVGFDGMESSVGLIEGKTFGASGPPTTTYATFSWNFGDGSPEVKGYAPGSPTCEAPWLSPCAGSIFHSYAYGGKYTVTLTVTDVAGDTSSTTREVVVDGPPAPPPAPATTTTSGTTTTTGSGSTGAKIIDPIARAAVLSRSLKRALRKGLSIRYSVNEQVAGHFEVLISAALARKLHLHGSPATGLPSGTPPQVMIARAILVTTKAGTNTVQIKFSKTVDARLRKAGQVPLLLRMYVRDAASKSPATATVLTAITLGG